MDYWVLEDSLIIFKIDNLVSNILVIVHDEEGQKINTLMFQNNYFYAYGSKDVVKVGLIKDLGRGFYAMPVDRLPDKIEIMLFNENGNIKERKEIIF